MPNWTVIFWILGAITMAWAFVLYFVLADSPSKAFWLNEDQKFIAVQRVSAGMVGIKSKKFKIAQVKSAMLDPKTYLLFIATFATSIPTGVLSNFSTVMYVLSLRGRGKDELTLSKVFETSDSTLSRPHSWMWSGMSFR